MCARVRVRVSVQTCPPERDDVAALVSFTVAAGVLVPVSFQPRTSLNISYCLNEFRTPGHRRSDSAELPVASPRFASDYMGC